MLESVQAGGAQERSGIVAGLDEPSRETMGRVRGNSAQRKCGNSLPKAAARLAFPRLVLQTGSMAKPALDLTKLTPEEKLELIDELWTSISPEEFPLTDEQRAELHRRLDRLDEDGPTGISWDSVRAEMTPRS